MNGERLTDEEMLEHYINLAAEHGGKIKFQYLNGVALVVGDNDYYTQFDEKIASEVFYLLDHEVSEKMGFSKFVKKYIDDLDKQDNSN